MRELANFVYGLLIRENCNEISYLVHLLYRYCDWELIRFKLKSVSKIRKQFNYKIFKARNWESWNTRSNILKEMLILMESQPKNNWTWLGTAVTPDNNNNNKTNSEWNNMMKEPLQSFKIRRFEGILSMLRFLQKLSKPWKEEKINRNFDF